MQYLESTFLSRPAILTILTVIVSLGNANPVGAARPGATQCELMIAKQRSEAINDLVQHGFASPVEKLLAERRVAILQEQMAAEASRETQDGETQSGKTVRLAEDHSPRATVTLPGLSADAFAPLRTVEIPLDLPSGTNVDVHQGDEAISVEPQRQWLEQELHFQHEMLRRLGEINDHSPASLAEIELHTRRAEQLDAMLRELEPTTVLATHPSPDQTDTSPQTDPSNASNFVRHSDIQAASDALSDDRMQTENLLAAQKVHWQSLQATVDALENLPRDTATDQEIKATRIQVKIAKAQIDQLDRKLQRLRLAQDYVAALPSANDGQTPQVSRQQIDATINAAIALIQHAANDPTEIAMAEAESERATFRAGELETLHAEQHATWLEVQRAKLELARAQCMHRAAIEKQSVAARTAHYLQQQQALAEQNRSNEQGHDEPQTPPNQHEPLNADDPSPPYGDKEPRIEIPMPPMPPALKTL